MSSRKGFAAVLLLLAGCRAPGKPPSPEPPPVATTPAPSPEMDDTAWRVEMKQVLYKSHMENARRYRDGAELEKALEEVDQALVLQPASEEARQLRLELQRMVGVRAGEAQTLLEDAWLAQQVREEQRAVEARRALDEARAAEAAGDFDRAITAYKRALYLAGEDDALRAEVEAAKAGPSGR